MNVAGCSAFTSTPVPANGNDPVQLLLFHQHLAQGLVGPAGAEEDPVRHNHRCPAPRLEQPQEEGQEEQLCLFGFDHRQQILGRAVIVK
jgi:hypothetical protein